MRTKNSLRSLGTRILLLAFIAVTLGLLVMPAPRAAADIIPTAAWSMATKGKVGPNQALSFDGHLFWFERNGRIDMSGCGPTTYSCNTTDANNPDAVFIAGPGGDVMPGPPNYGYPFSYPIDSSSWTCGSFSRIEVDSYATANSATYVTYSQPNPNYNPDTLSTVDSNGLVQPPKVQPTQDSNGVWSDEKCIPDQPATIRLATAFQDCTDKGNCGSATGTCYSLSTNCGADSVSVNPDDCPVDKTFGIDYIVCPVFRMAKAAVLALNAAIQNALFINTKVIFGTDSSPSEFRFAYNSFRNTALGLLIIAGLVMVISQAIGLEMFSAHAVRKTLPRIVIAAIGMSLAWPILQFVITFFNDLGAWMTDLIFAATQVNAGSPDPGLVGNAVVNAVVVTAAGGGIIIFTAVTAMGVLSLFGTFALALLVGLLVLVIRQLLVIVCVIMAPLAIAAYVLPGTEKLWKFWKDTLLGALMMFPIIMGFLATGAALANIAGAAGKAAAASGDTAGNINFSLLALIAYFVPYFILPLSFRMASGLMGNIFGMVNDRGKGLFDRLRKFREGEKEFEHQRRMQGKSRVPGGSLYRRLHTRGGIGFTPNSWRQGGALVNKQMQLAAGKTLQEDGGIAVNDDTANELAAERGMTHGRFVERYARSLAGTGPVTAQHTRAAEQAYARITSSYNATMGSAGMRIAAYKAATQSTTSFFGAEAGGSGDLDAGRSRMYRLGGDLVRDGLMNSADATAAIKFNQGAASRRDRSAVGFGATAKEITLASQGVAAGTGGRLSATELNLEAWKGAKPGEIVYGRPETVGVLADPMRTTVAAAAASGSQADFAAMLAKVAGIYDAMAQTSPENADILARRLMNQTVTFGNETKNIQQFIEDYRNDPGFTIFRREYSSTRGQIQANQQQQAPNPGNGAPQPPQAFTP